MARDLHPATATALFAPTLYPAWVIRLDIKDDPVEVWTGLQPYAPSGTGDASLDGITFDPVGAVGQISALVDSAEGSQTLALDLPGIDLQSDALKQFVWDARTWQFRSAWVWLALLNESGAVQGRPIRFKTGRMDNIYVRSSEGEGLLTCEIESHQAYAGEALTSRYSEQKEIDSTDTSQDYVHALANMQPNLGVAPSYGYYGGSGGGGGVSGGSGGGAIYGGGGGGGNCPAPGTMVLTPDMTEVAVETLRPGDEVYTQRDEDLCWGAYRVLDCQVVEDQRWRLELEDGRELLATPGHRMHVEGEGWVELDSLQPGQRLAGLTPGVVRRVSKADHGEVVHVMIEGASTYQTWGLLSHNIKMRDIQLY